MTDNGQQPGVLVGTTPDGGAIIARPDGTLVDGKGRPLQENPDGSVTDVDGNTVSEWDVAIDELLTSRSRCDLWAQQ